MKQVKIPMRSCCATNEKLPKRELIRIVRTPENDVKVDLTGKLNGRGAYIKKDVTVLDKVIKSKILEKKLEVQIPSEVYEEIRNLVKVN